MHSAYGIFRSVQRRFRRIELKPVGFPLNAQQSTNANDFLFAVNSRSEHHAGSPSRLNVKAAQVAFAFAFDWKSAGDPNIQMDAAAWAAIMNGPFAGREFYVEPRDEVSVRAMFDDESNKAVPLTLSHSGSAIQGLTLSESVFATSWRFFIPEESPEGKAISLAFELARERRKYRSSQTASGAALIDQLIDTLSVSVSKLQPA